MVDRNGEREVMEANSLRVAMSHFFAYLRDSYCGEIDITKAELSKEFIDQLVTLRGRFKASYFLMRPVHFVDVSLQILCKRNANVNL